MEKETILQAHHARFACKKFDPDKKISDEDLRFILEIARLSPSSIGSEPWKFVVVKDETLRQALKPICWNQDQITRASDLVVILSKNENHLVNEGYLEELVDRKGLSQYAKSFVLGLPSIGEWTKKQCYIALGNIMSSAAMMGIDSCPIEGFDSPEAVGKALGIDPRYYDVAVMVALGYRDMPITPKTRLPFDDVVTFLE